MSSHQPVPAAFADLVNLADDLTGTFVLYATDDYFAEKENLLKPHAAEWRAEAYTDKGKWMDGWESMRKREPGHDFCIIRLGTPGSIHGVLCDTTHFKGNAPQEISLEICDVAHTLTPAELLALPVVDSLQKQHALRGRAWLEVLPQTAVLPDFGNVLPLLQASSRASHVRMHIYPDGGVARLRVYGQVLPEPRLFWRPGSLDLAAIEHGGTIAAVSDQFFGPPSNLLLPGRGVNMGDGWETKRRRTPGSDWCAIKLARRGIVERIELDTHFFKGNAPQAARVEWLDATGLSEHELQARLVAVDGWQTLVEKTPLVQHRKHTLEPARPQPLTHIRVHMFPHGGINRLRVFGHALDTHAEKHALHVLNFMPDTEFHQWMMSFCGSSAFAEAMASQRTFADVRGIFAAAENTFWALRTDDFLQAFSAHPRIGATSAAQGQTAQSVTWSKNEQAQMADAAVDVTAELGKLNDEYFEKFGFIFICFASGRTPQQMLDLLQARIHNSRALEIDNAAQEQARILRLRLENWLNAQH